MSDEVDVDMARLERCWFSLEEGLILLERRERMAGNLANLGPGGSDLMTKYTQKKELVEADLAEVEACLGGSDFAGLDEKLRRAEIGLNAARQLWQQILGCV